MFKFLGGFLADQEKDVRLQGLPLHTGELLEEFVKQVKLSQQRAVSIHA